jgi:branched-chain amino acid transport system substrate-binding protein
MRKMPVDFLGRPVRIRADGRVLYDMSLYRVTMPDESRYLRDDDKVLRTIPAAEAFRAPDPAVCPLAKGS